MRRFAAVCGMSALGLFAGLVPASADDNNQQSPFMCNGTYTNTTINNDLEVPANGVCVLNASHVTGNVQVDTNSYFESNRSNLDNEVLGIGALTLYIRNHSVVKGDVLGYQTPQLFVYDSVVNNSVAAYQPVTAGYGHFQVCGNTVGGSIAAARLGPDVLIGDPAGGCAGNTVTTGGIYAYQNSTNAELTVRSNTIKAGGLHVLQNTGSSQKFVQSNTLPKGQLECSGNAAPFVGSPNGAHGSTKGGQCA